MTSVILQLDFDSIHGHCHLVSAQIQLSAPVPSQEAITVTFTIATTIHQLDSSATTITLYPVLPAWLNITPVGLSLGVTQGMRRNIIVVCHMSGH